MAEPTVDLTEYLQLAQEMGFFEVAIPFLLVFAVSYGVLQTVGLFKDNDKIPAVIAFVLGMLVTGSGVFTNTLSAFSPYLGVVLFFVLSFLIVFGLITGTKLSNVLEDHDKALGLIAIGIFIFLAFTFGSSVSGGAENGTGTGESAGSLIWGVLQENLPVLILAGVVIIGIWLVVSGGSSSDGNGNQNQ